MQLAIQKMNRNPWTREDVRHFLRTAANTPGPADPTATNRMAFYMHGMTQASWRDQEMDDMVAAILARHRAVVANATWGAGPDRERAEAVLSDAITANPKLDLMGYVPINVPMDSPAPGSLLEKLRACPRDFRLLVNGRWKPPAKQSWLHIDFDKPGAYDWWLDTVDEWRDGRPYNGIALDTAFAEHRTADWPDQEFAARSRWWRATLLYLLRQRYPNAPIGIIFGPWEGVESDLEMVAHANYPLEEGCLTPGRGPMRFAKAINRYQVAALHGCVPGLGTRTRRREDQMPLPDPYELLYLHAMARMVGGVSFADGGGEGGVGISHTELYWHPWDNVALGQPKGEIFFEGPVARRRFERGEVLVHTGGFRQPAFNGEFFPRWRSHMSEADSGAGHQRVRLGQVMFSFRGAGQVRDMWLAPWQADIVTPEDQGQTTVWPNYVPPRYAQAVARHTSELIDAALP